MTLTGRARHLPDRQAAVCRPAHRGRADRRRAHLLPGARPRPTGRTALHHHREALLMTTKGNKAMETGTTSIAQPPPAPPLGGAVRGHRARKLFEPKIVRSAVVAAFRKLDPRVQLRNPAMFVVEVGSVLVTLRFLVNLIQGGGPGGRSFTGQVALWLWFTVLFANFAEAMAEGRGKAQADQLRRTRKETTARRLRQDGSTERVPPPPCARAMRSWSRPARSSPATAKSSRASPQWTSRPSPVSPLRSSARRAGTAPRSPAAPRCSPTGSACASPPSPARASSTA